VARIATALPGALVLLVLVPAAAQASAPTLLSVGSSNGYPTARWSLAGDSVSRFVEVGETRRTRASGEFVDPPLRARVAGLQRSWRSFERLDPGIYFVHVGAVEQGCAPCPEEWSNVRRLVIRAPRPYAGRTSQGRGITFVLRGLGFRIVPLTFRFKADCARGNVSGFVKFGRPIRVRPDGAFSARARVRTPIDTVLYRVRGRLFEPPGATRRSAANGIVRFTAFRSPAGRCDSGPVRWTATGLG
jgi:hypothetical protein